VNKKIVWFALIITITSTATFAQEDRKIEQAIKHRKAAFTLMVTYWSRILQTIEGTRPYDPNAVIIDAKKVEYLSRLPWEGFVAGSERGDTKAKDDIWLDEEQFKKLAKELEVKTTNLVKEADLKDLKKLKVAFEQARDICSACHKEFRKK
jgi:cytochrome c556